MNRIKLIAMAMALIPFPAIAADMPTKAAPAVIAGYPAPTGIGLYGQIGTFAEIANSSVSTGAASTNLFSAGGALSGAIGYQYRVPGLGLGFTEASINYTNLGGATSCNIGNGIVTSCSVAGPWGFAVGTAVQFNWTYPFTFIPALSGLFNGNTPSSLLPAGVVPTSSIPYAGIWADINSVSANINGMASNSVWQVAPEFRLGLINYLPQGGGVLKTWVGYEFAQSSFSVGQGNTAQMGNIIRAGLDYAF